MILNSFILVSFECCQMTYFVWGKRFFLEWYEESGRVLKVLSSLVLSYFIFFILTSLEPYGNHSITGSVIVKKPTQFGLQLVFHS